MGPRSKLQASQKKSKGQKTVPSEKSEHRALARILRRAGICFTHVPNGGLRGGARMGAADGVFAGFPDFLIFDAPAAHRGFAIELKRQGAPPSAVRPEQQAWLDRLDGRGWSCFVARGAEDAYRWLATRDIEIGRGDPMTWHEWQRAGARVVISVSRTCPWCGVESWRRVLVVHGCSDCKRTWAP